MFKWIIFLQACSWEPLLCKTNYLIGLFSKFKKQIIVFHYGMWYRHLYRNHKMYMIKNVLSFKMCLNQKFVLTSKKYWPPKNCDPKILLEAKLFPHFGSTPKLLCVRLIDTMKQWPYIVQNAKNQTTTICIIFSLK